MRFRRQFSRTVALGVAALGVVALAACGSSSQDSGDSAGGSGSAVAAAAFPAKVATQFGEVTIPSQPKRIVALGWSDAEFLLALGIQPVGVVDWLSYGDGGVGPWAKSLQTNKPALLSSKELDVEKILALNPDLILNVRSDNDAKNYDTLKKIAPTVYGPSGVTSFGTTWRQQMKSISAAVGLPAKGDEIIADVDAKIKKTAAANPVLAGKTVVVGAAFGGQWGAYVSGDGRADFMTDLGMKISPNVEALKKDSFYVTISAERLDLLSADLTVMFSIDGKGAELKADPALNAISSAQAHHLLVMTNLDETNAFSAASTLSVAWALDHVVPSMAAAAEGKGN